MKKEKEVITGVEEVSEGWGSGFEVSTSKQTIRLLIEDGQQCCESWGYFWCNDNPDGFVGAELLDVKLTGEALNEEVFSDSEAGVEYFEGGIMFVDLVTDRGVLQFVAYNNHNGYYGHQARIECQQLSHEETL